MIIETTNINKKFADFELHNCSLQIKEGSYVVVLGLSGAGKSVLLELLAGVLKADSGEIFYQNRELKYSDFKSGEIGLMFQNYALFPHMTVFDNIAYPLKNQKKPKSEIDSEVNLLSKKLEINHLLHRKPGDLSGGEAQRVALARILALKPKVLLLDEPLSAVDIQLKSSLKRLLKKLNREGLTIIHVTHDYEEALALARHIVVMDKGRIVQQGGPAEVFKNPESPFVANFMGAKNFFKAKKLDEGEIIINNKIKLFSNINSGKKNGYAMVSQEEISLFKTKPEFSSARNLLSGVITDIIPNQYGFEVLLDCGLEFSVYITRKSLKSMEINEGENLWLSFKAASVKFIEN